MSILQLWLKVHWSFHASRQRNRGKKPLWSDAFTCIPDINVLLPHTADRSGQRKQTLVIPFFQSTAGQCVFPSSQQANLPQPPLALGGCCLCNFVWLCACAFGVFSFSPPCLCWTTASAGSASPKPFPVIADGQSPATVIFNDAPPLFRRL